MHKYFINGKALYKCIALILLADIFTDFYSSHRKFLYSTVFEHTPHLPPKVVYLSFTPQSSFSQFTHLNKRLDL